MYIYTYVYIYIYLFAALCRVTSHAKNWKVIHKLENDSFTENKTTSLQHERSCQEWSREKLHNKPLQLSPMDSTLFTPKLWGSTQVCSLEASCFWHGFSSTPDAIPSWVKCAGNCRWMRLQALRRVFVNLRRDGSSAKLLWLGTLPNHGITWSRNSSWTKVSVNSFAIRVDPTPWT